MGLDLYLCKACKDPKTEYNGGCIEKCINKCDSWICYDCVDRDDKIRHYDDNDDNNEKRTLCIVCDENDEFETYIEKLKLEINKLYSKNLISKNRKSKIDGLINYVKYAK
jgi:hypothetical protein